MLEALGYVSRILHFKESVNSLLTSRIQLVFLVMREVSEQGFGVAIKISSSGFSVPLVAAGPAWTRTMVLKAVKYGACDILVTPSTVEDVREKLATNLVKKAA
jgi:DNA-binding NtrC family response regulator